jgi:hypothetical protein
VQTCVSRIPTKLGAKSQAEIAREALRQDILPEQRWPAGVIARKLRHMTTGYRLA